MADALSPYIAPPLDAELAEMLDTPLEPDPLPDGVAPGAIVEGTVKETDDDYIYLEMVGDQFGRCFRDDVSAPGAERSLEIGDPVEVLVEEEIDEGRWNVSAAKAYLLGRQSEVARWAKDKRRVHGRVNVVIKGGFAVSAEGIRCFLPGRESGIRFAEAFDAVGNEYDFDVIRYDRRNTQPVLSRRSLADAERKAARAVRLQTLQEGEVMEGPVVSLKPFGAFVDLGGVDGLCHVSELSLHHIDHPRQVVGIGDVIHVKVVEIDREKGRVGLSRRDLLGDARKDRIAGIEPETVVEGTVKRLTDFGAFVEIAPEIEGLCHVSELAWRGRPKHPSEILEEGAQVRVKVLEVDPDTGRIALSLRQTGENPWEALATSIPPGSATTGRITRIEDYGLFVALTDDVEGLCHVSDLTWEGRPERPNDVADYAVGNEIEVKVLEIDRTRGRVSLGVKQLEADPWDDAGESLFEGSIIKGTVTRFEDKAAYLEVVGGIEARLYIAEISTERVENIRAVLRIGQEVDVMVLKADRQRRRLDVSIKAIMIKLEAETPKSFADDATEMNPMAAALQASGLVEEDDPVGDD